MLVSVDFDGTITQSADPDDAGFNVIRPGCREALIRLSALGIRFRLLTGRGDRWTEEAVDLCKKWDLPLDLSDPHRKVISDVFIDDKNLGCTGIDWEVIYTMLLAQIGVMK